MIDLNMLAPRRRIGGRRSHGFVSALLVAACLACGGDDGNGGPMAPPPPPPPAPPPPPPPPPPVAAPVIVGTADLENFGDARDVEVTFRETGDAAEVDEYRIFIARSSAVGTGTPPTTGSFQAASGPAETAVAVRLTAAVTDEAGDDLVEGVAYVAYVQAWTGTADDSPISPVSAELTLTRQNIVESVTAIAGGTGGVAVDSAGNVFVADFGPVLSGPSGTQLFRVTPEGDVSVFATGFSGASGNAFDSQGDLFQSSIGGNFISRVDPDGTVSTFVSGGAIVGPVGIAVAPGDTLYVANCNNNTVAKVTPSGIATTLSSDPMLSCPNGIALASDGNLYVANFFNGNMIRLSLDGTATPFVTLPGNNLGHVTFGNGVLYVAARGAHRIYEVTLEGSATVLAGTGARGRADGPALQSSLSFTNDLALSPDGSTLYFNDVDLSVSNTNSISPSWLRKIRLEAE